MENLFWQVGLAVGQLLGVALILKIIISEIKNEIKDIRNEIKDILEKHYELREEVAREYLKKDDFLAFNNKLEAEIKNMLKDILRRIKDDWKTSKRSYNKISC